MNFRTLNIIFLILSFNLSFGQTNLINPHKGIDGVPVLVDSSNISEVIKIYSNDFQKTVLRSFIYYRYENIGLTFEIDAYDKNEIVRSIYIESPFKAKTKNGITLNESTMDDVLKLYNETGCFVLKDCVMRPQKGISYYIRKEPNTKGYDLNEKIFKIEVHNNNENGIASDVNFIFNSFPVEQKIEKLISILNSENLDFNQLNTFWEEESKTEGEPYGLRQLVNFKRIIENNLIQESYEFIIVYKAFELNIIKSNDSLVYLKLTDVSDKKTLFERLEKKEFDNTDFNVYTFGTACGIGGIPPDKCIEMLILIKEKNYNELASWLQSKNPEISTYGYIGIDILNRGGFKILPKESVRMNELRKSNIQLNTCQG